MTESYTARHHRFLLSPVVLASLQTAIDFAKARASKGTDDPADTTYLKISSTPGGARGAIIYLDHCDLVHLWEFGQKYLGHLARDKGGIHRVVDRRRAWNALLRKINVVARVPHMGE